MHCAPSVEYPVGRSVFAQGVFLVLVSAWLLGQVLWAVSLTGNPWPGAWWFSAGAGLLLAVWGYWRLKQPPQGRLHWVPPAAGSAGAGDGQAGAWQWFSAAYRHGTPLDRVEWVWDLQGMVLLRLRNAAGLSWWVWLERSFDPGVWDDLRRALKAHQS
ncbi:hypothetical protein [Hydrogenophaga aquatica]